MAALLRCNICFRQPGHAAQTFALTSCGHVLCEGCLQRGTKEECPVCKSVCRTIFLSNQTSPEVKMLFMDINVLCKRYSKEFTQIVEFQESHRRRSLEFYKGKIAKLEETIKKLTQQVESYSQKPPESCNRFPFSSMARTSGSKPSCWCCWVPQNQDITATPAEHSQGSLIAAYACLQDLPALYAVENCEGLGELHKILAYETVAGTTRLSLISPPQDGRMGQITYRSSTQSSLAGPLRRSQMEGSQQVDALHPFSQSLSQRSRQSAWNMSSQRASHVFQQTPQSSQTGTRPPISLTDILQRHV
ncbi:putative E3 SUMO-protein ligase RNF212 [Pelodytes ibericus]